MEEQAKYEVNVTPEMEERSGKSMTLPIDERQELLDIIDDSIENDAEWAAIKLPGGKRVLKRHPSKSTTKPSGVSFKKR